MVSHHCAHCIINPINAIMNMANSFEQLSDKIAGKYSETGIGLSITKHLTGRHGGDLSQDSTPNTGSVFSLLHKKEESQNVSITWVYDFNISHLMELGDEESIRYVLELIIKLIPQYISDLSNAVSREDKADFLAKSHKLRGSISTIHIPAIVKFIAAADGIAKTNTNWESLLPILDRIMAIYESVFPKISEEVERQIEKINNDKLIAA